MKKCLASEISRPPSQLGCFPPGPLEKKIISYPYFCSKKRGLCSLSHKFKGRRPWFSRTEIIHSPNMVDFIRHPKTFLNSQIHDNQQNVYFFHVNCVFSSAKTRSLCQSASAEWAARLTHYLNDASHSRHNECSKTSDYSNVVFQGYSQVNKNAKSKLLKLMECLEYCESICTLPCKVSNVNFIRIAPKYKNKVIKH